MPSILLTEQILESLNEHFKLLQHEVCFMLQRGEHKKRNELLQFLTAIATKSEYLSVREVDLGQNVRSPITFRLEANGTNTGISFSGIPSGHEFNSLILAILHAGGVDPKLDESVTRLIKEIKSTLNFEIFVSLSCTNCPDVVQTFNKFAILNKNITVETIDGGLFQDTAEAMDIQGVPSVYLDGNLFAGGRVEISKVLDKLRVLENLSNLQNVEKIQRQDVAVIGGGPAGVSAAIYLARKGFRVVLIAEIMGGQVRDTMGIENLISVPRTTGSELTQDLKRHLADYEVLIKEHAVVTNIKQGEIKVLTLADGDSIEAKTVIVATGAKWRELGIPGEKENIGRGVAFCPHCDGPYYKNKKIAVVGGGNSGVEAALDLSLIVNHVTILEFQTQLKADDILIERVKKAKNISYKANVECQQILSKANKVNSITYRDRASGLVDFLDIEGVFIQIGLIPNTEFISELIKLNEYGEIIVDSNGQTSQPGIFACGDVTTDKYKQIVIAMGGGAMVSLAVAEYLTAAKVA